VIHPHHISDKRIGISVLNWGLGHVTRSIPIIRALCEKNNQLFIFCNESQKLIFSQYMNDVKYVYHPGYPFKFNGKGRFKMDLLRVSRSLYINLKSEKQLVQGYVKKYTLDMLISDQRYGFFSNNVPSIFITHQLQFPLRGIFKIGNLMNRYQVSKFSTIWIMDNEDHRNAGMLSQNKNYDNAIYIGCHSRFQVIKKQSEKEVKGLLVFNGPEVYSQLLLDTFMSQINSGEIEKIIGPESVKPLLLRKNITTPFFASSDMSSVDQIFITTSKIFGFFGYTTLMDCLALGCAYHLVPTPGQDEQIYLAKRHKKSPKRGF
tara:strand:- start:854 stop:1807 length:954 start_codon:yes stop_codon:yes gene_type:complete